MPNIRIKSSHRRLLVLLAFTFLVGTMITIVNYNQNIAQQQRYVLNDNDRTAMLNYFKYSHLKRNLVSDQEVNLNKNNQYQSSNNPHLNHNDNNKSIQQALSSSLNLLLNSPINQANAPFDQQVKLSSTTFSDGKESSTKFLINRDVNNNSSKDNKNNKIKVYKEVDKSIDQNDKLTNKITPAPSISQDKVLNFTNSNKTVIKQQEMIKQNLISNNKSTPVYTHSEAELNLTRKFRIDKKGFCSKEHGYGIDLLVMVITSPANFDARNAIRQTWGGFAVERGSKLLFVVGSSPNAQINEKIKQEDNQYQDILQGKFQDAYYNLTLKSLAIVNWVADNCEKAKYVLKIDDDMFVNMQLLVDFAETREFKNVIIGKIAKKWLPHRDSNSKWYVPNSAYSGQVYPNFATGPAYLIHRDAIPNLAKIIRSNSTKVIKLEDVFLAGIVAEKAGVRRLNYSLFKNAYFDVNKCNFMRFITSHQHSPKEIIRLWQLVYSDKKVDCNVKSPSTVTKAPAIKKEVPPKLVQKSQIVQKQSSVVQNLVKPNYQKDEKMMVKN